MSFIVFKDEVLEAAAREAVRLDESRALLDRFITLIRESGTTDEATAGHYLVSRLQALGVPVTLHTPELYISIPVRAELSIAATTGGRTLHARPPAMGRATGDVPVEGDICYVPTKYATAVAAPTTLAPDPTRQTATRLMVSD